MRKQRIRFLSRCLPAWLLPLLLFTAGAQAAVSLRGASQNAIASLPASGISYVGAGARDSRNSCGSINPSIPAGSNGDILIALVITKESSTTVSMSGWKTYYSATYPTPGNNNSELQAYVFWRVATGGDPNTITQSGTCDNMAAQITRFSGVDTSNPFETGAPGVVAQDSGSIDAGPITTSSATSMLLVAGYVSNDRTVSPDPGWNQAFNFSINQGGAKPDLGMSLHYQTQTAAGSKSISNWNLSGGGSDDNFGIMFALRPAVVGLTINVPAGTTAGDVMVAAIAVRPYTIAITPPAGWTSLNRVDQAAGNSNSQEIFYRVATAGEPASYTWTFSGAIGGAAGGIASYSGVDAAAPIDVYGGNATPYGTSHTASSITTTADNAMVISTHSFSSAESWTPPSGMTEEVDVASLSVPNAPGISLEMNDVTQATAGATGNKTATAGGNADTGVAQLLALKPGAPPPVLLADYRMDESAWTGTAGEVQDQTGNFPGTAQNGVTTNGTSPAIASDPGTCRYGEFDGVDDYVQVNNLSTILDGTASLAFWINTTQTGNNTGWQAPGVTGVEQAGGADDIFWGWLDASGHIGISVGNDYTTKSTTVINDGNWHHVVLTRDATAGTYKIYIDGSLNASGSIATGTIGTAFASIGRIEDTGGTPEYFNGLLDEVRVYDSVLSNSQVTAVMNATHPCPVAVTPQADWRMDETSWSGTAGEVVDNSGNGHNGTALGSAQTADVAPVFAGNPGTCGYATFPANTSATPADAVDTGLNPAADVGNTGSITFWYYSSTAWGSGNDQQIFDASDQTSRRYFFLTLRRNGRLRFAYQDSANGTHRIESTGQSFAANEWVHITVTWDLPNNSQQLYINGTLAASGTNNTTGVLGTLKNLYLGDNNGEYIRGGATPNSANGGMDEVRVYNTVLTPAQINTIMNDTHPCAVVDHYEISHSGTGVTCLSEPVTITAIDGSGNPIDPGNVTVNLSTIPVSGSSTTPPAKGDWVRVAAGSGTLSNASTNGTADYQFPGNGETSATLIFDYTRLETGNTSETVNFNIDDTANNVTDTRNSDPATDPDLTVALTGFQFYNETAGNAVVPDQIAGKPSDTAPNNAVIGLRAVRASDNDPSMCVAAFPNGSTVSIPLGAECRNPNTCAGRQMQITNNGNTTAVATSNDNGGAGAAAYTPVNLLFQDDGTGITRALLSLRYPDAGVMQLHARYEVPLDQGGSPPAGPGSGGYMNGATNDFTVRPFGFAIGPIQDPGGNPNPGADTPGGALFVSAGSDFQATVGAYNWDAADDDGSTCDLTSDPGCAAGDGIPDTNANLRDNNGGYPASLTPNYQGGGAVAVTLTAVAPSAPSTAVGGTLGQLLDSNTGAVPVIPAGAFSGGTAVLSTLTYLEAGSMTLKASASDYLGAGAVSGRSSNLGTNPNNGAVGRFGADHFIFSANTPALGPACGSFTYVDQPFDYTTAPQITARAVAADGSTVLTNYGDFSSAGGADWWLLDRAPTSGGGGVGVTYTDLAAPTDIHLDSSVATYTPNSGITGSAGQQLFTLAGPFAYAKNAPPISPQPPFDGSLRLDFTVTDSDGATGTYTINPLTFNSPQMRWGRLVVGNAAGSERLPLQVPLRAQYWNGYAFVTNTADSCTAVSSLASGVLLSNPDTAGGAQQPGNTAMIINDGTTQITSGAPALTGGKGSLVFSAPYDGDAIPDTGYVNLTLDLAPTAADLSWLEFDWNGDGAYDNNPSARATFGIYHGSNAMIYLREPWN